MKISVILFDRFELLDVFGPVELFSLVPGWDVEYFSEVAGHVASSQGLEVIAPSALSDLQGAEMILVPGGLGTRTLVHDQEFLNQLFELTQNATIVSSVCTGSALLAAAGVLDGCQATSNKMAFDWVVQWGTQVSWQKSARWVEDGKYWTSSGIAAGIDMAAAMIRRYAGDGVCQDVCRRAEISVSTDATDDPFALS